METFSLRVVVCTTTNEKATRLFSSSRVVFCSDGVTPNSVYYKNCAEAHADGRYDIPEGDPTYRPELDKDHNGIACESRKPG
jgi:Excalibur calcium-binding domain